MFKAPPNGGALLYITLANSDLADRYGVLPVRRALALQRLCKVDLQKSPPGIPAGFAVQFRSSTSSNAAQMVCSRTSSRSPSKWYSLAKAVFSSA